ncbi:MAG: alpha-E domain-containing protein [Nitriliruptoraceae bacterium]
MLARVAESLFWAGRYVERAEGTSRAADVAYHTLLESPPREIERTWDRVLDALYLTDAYGPGGRSSLDVLTFLVGGAKNPSSITTSLVRARENIRSVRDHVSTELWEAINDLHLTLAHRDITADLADRPFELLGVVRRGCTTMYGAASDTMPRDAGWRFLALGRLLERAEMTCRLIDVGYGQLEALGGPSRRLQATDEVVRGADRTDFHQWVALLKSASAFEAYRRRYRSSMDPADVVEFLVLERQLPRSVVFCLDGALEQIEALASGTATTASRQVGRLVASLKYRDVTELFADDLHEVLHEVERDIARAAEGIADVFFRYQPTGSLHAVATT